MRTAEHIRYLILAAQREGNRQLMARLAKIGLTPAQSEALRIIADHGPLALRELGDMLVCDSGTSPSRIVDRLVVAGLVRRDASAQDRRQVQLRVTPEGKNRAAQVSSIEDQLYGVIDGTLDAADAHALMNSLLLLTTASPARAALERRLAAEDQQAQPIR